jgi:spore maturation protein CgeB
LTHYKIETSTIVSSILYIGTSGANSTSRHRADALKRLGHDVIIFDPHLECSWHLRNRYFFYCHYRAGFRLLQPIITKAFFNWRNRNLRHFDIVYVDSGEWIGPRLALGLRSVGTLILYVLDDPTGGNDRRRFDMLKIALCHYDLCAVVREQNVEEFTAHGARHVIRVWRSYDEVSHLPVELSQADRRQYQSEVCFAGTWFPERGPFMARLLECGVPLSIWGDRWQKAREWSKLKSAWRGPAIYNDAYAKIVCASKVMLGLLSKGNRDLHTQRSLEIPRLGGLLCAERTPEHEELFEDWKEAVFWNNGDECAQICFKLLSDTPTANRIRLAGQKRVVELQKGNENICREILEVAALNKLITACNETAKTL